MSTRDWFLSRLWWATICSVAVVLVILTVAYACAETPPPVVYDVGSTMADAADN